MRGPARRARRRRSARRHPGREQRHRDRVRRSLAADLDDAARGGPRATVGGDRAQHLRVDGRASARRETIGAEDRVRRSFVPMLRKSALRRCGRALAGGRGVSIIAPTLGAGRRGAARVGGRRSAAASSHRRRPPSAAARAGRRRDRDDGAQLRAQARLGARAAADAALGVPARKGGVLSPPKSSRRTVAVRPTTGSTGARDAPCSASPATPPPREGELRAQQPDALRAGRRPALDSAPVATLASTGRGDRRG